MIPTPLEVAAALRSAAEFCRDPDSPKAQHIWAKTANGVPTWANAPDAVSWCALGWACRQLEIQAPTELPLDARDITGIFDFAFNYGDFEPAALACERAAAKLEASLPLAAERVTRDEVTTT